jgi:hypothetical protein
MSPQFPNPAQQGAQRAIAANELARSQQLSRERAAARRRNSTAARPVGPTGGTSAGDGALKASPRTSAGGGALSSSQRYPAGGGTVGLFFRIVAFVAFLVILALIVNVGIAIVHSHPGP